MNTPLRDPLQIPSDLQPRFDAIPGLRALYRRGSFARTLGLACLPLLLPVALLASVCLEGMAGRPAVAHVPAGYGMDAASLVSTLFTHLMIAGTLLGWMAFGLYRVLRNRGVRHFTFSFLIGGSLLAAMVATTGIASPGLGRSETGAGVRLEYSKLSALVDGPHFAALSPAWQAYLRAQLPLGSTREALDHTGMAIARGEDIGIPVPAAMQARFEAKAELPHSARSQEWLRSHWLRLALWATVGKLAAWSLLPLLLLGIGLTILGYHVRGRARVINGLLLQLQPPQASAQP